MRSSDTGDGAPRSPQHDVDVRWTSRGGQWTDGERHAPRPRLSPFNWKHPSGINATDDHIYTLRDFDSPSSPTTDARTSHVRVRTEGTREKPKEKGTERRVPGVGRRVREGAEFSNADDADDALNRQMHALGHRAPPTQREGAPHPALRGPHVYSAMGAPSVDPILFCTCAPTPPRLRLGAWATEQDETENNDPANRTGKERKAKSKEGRKIKKGIEETQERGKKENKDEWEREGTREGEESRREDRNARRTVDDAVDDAVYCGKVCFAVGGSEHKRGGDEDVRGGGGEEPDEGAGVEFGFAGEELDEDMGGGVEATGEGSAGEEDDEEGAPEVFREIPDALGEEEFDRHRDEHLLSAFTKCGPHDKGVRS